MEGSKPPLALPDDVFLLARDRDAWATIRGFVYQVDVSILRWLELGSDEVLVLERGEDIDRVTGFLTAPPADQERLLEQVKHLEAPITLRSAAARSALANFFEHRRANPGLRIRFRLTTTAKVGREQNTPMPGRLRGLEAWESFRAGQLTAEQKRDVLLALRPLLIEAQAPEGIPETQWSAYQAWVKVTPEDQFAEFVGQVEWATAAPDMPSLRQQLQDRVVEKGLASTVVDASRIYQQLFAAIFTRLSARGVKRFTLGDLISTLTRPSAADQALVQRLAHLHEVLSGRVELLEQRMQHVEVVIAAATDQIYAVAAQAGVSATVDLSGSPPLLDEPMPPARASTRAETVRALVPTATRPVTVALFGPQSSGKTQLARLIIHSLGERRLWIHLLNISPARAAAEVIAAVRTILSTSHDPVGPMRDWRADCAALAAQADAIAIDDVPMFREGDALGQRLVPLLVACRSAGTSTVLTSTLPLTSIERVIPSDALVSSKAPPFTVSEVKEVFASYGASAAALDSSMIAILRGIAAGHPVLLHAVAQYLRARDWALGEDILDDLFRGRFAEPINLETARTLLADISDEATRDLLYRLTTADAEFTSAEVEALASVPPALNRRGERFATLLGPWVQESGLGRYTLSALVQVLGAGDLADGTRRECHLVLARRILATRRLNELQVERAVVHFSAGEDFERAGLVLLQALHALHGLKRTGVARGVGLQVTRLWGDTALPEAMSPRLRLQIRAYQSVIAHRTMRDPSMYIADMEEILDEAEVPPWYAIASTMLVAITFAPDNVRIAAPFMRRALTAWYAAPSDVQAKFVFQESKTAVPIEGLTLLCLGAVHSDIDRDAWLDEVAALPAELRAWLSATGKAPELVAMLATRIMMEEYDKEASEQDWVAAAVKLDALASRAESMNLSSLAAAASAVRLTCLIEAGTDYSDVETLAEGLAGTYATAPDLMFLVARHMGMASIEAGHVDQGIVWLTRAEESPGVLFLSDRVHVRMRLAQRVVQRDPMRAISLADSAVMLAQDARAESPRETGDVQEVKDPLENVAIARVSVAHGDILLLQALGERALVRWSAGDRNGAATEMLATLDCLFTRRDDSDRFWRAAAVTVGHVSGFLSSMMTTGAGPRVGETEEPYVTPVPGMFAGMNLQVETLYNPSATPILAMHAMMLADAIGDETGAVVWATRSLVLAKQQGVWRAVLVPLSVLTRLAIVNRAYSEAIGHAADAAAAYWLLREEPRGTVGILDKTPPRGGLPPREVAGAEAWRDVDSLVLGEAFLPAFLAVATEHLKDAAHATGYAFGLRDACAKQASETANSSAWLAATEICDAAFLSPADSAKLRTRAKGFADDESLLPLAVAATVGASLDPVLPPVQAFYWHLSVGEYIHRRVGHDKKLYEACALPFFETYWQTMVRRVRPQLSAPGLADAQLGDALRAPASVRLQRIFEVVAAGLGIPVPAGAKGWVYADPLSS